MKAVIIGVNGYLGRNLYQFLMSKEVEVVGVDISENPVDSSIRYQKADITKINEISGVDLMVDVVYLFSGLTGTWEGFHSYSNFVDVNEKGLLNLLTVHNQQMSRARIVFPSTRLVYKGVTDKYLNENDETHPKTIYALNKLSCENILNIYYEVFNINYTVFRICVPYGHLIPGCFSYGTIGFFLNKALNGQNIQLFGDGSLKRTFTHIEDICFRIWKAVLLKSTENQIYNIGGEVFSLRELSEIIGEQFNIGVDYVPWSHEALIVESGDTIFDGSKLDNIVSEPYQHSISNWVKSIKA